MFFYLRGIGFFLILCNDYTEQGAAAPCNSQKTSNRMESELWICLGGSNLRRKRSSIQNHFHVPPASSYIRIFWLLRSNAHVSLVIHADFVCGEWVFRSGCFCHLLLSSYFQAHPTNRFAKTPFSKWSVVFFVSIFFHFYNRIWE